MDHAATPSPIRPGLPSRTWLALAGLLAGGPPHRRPVFADTQPAIFRSELLEAVGTSSSADAAARRSG